MPATEPIPFPRLLTVKEAAEALHVHPDTIRRWSDQGRLAYVRYGTGKAPDRRLFRAEDLEAFLAAHTHGGAA